jgi:hypothetical protein
MVESESGKVRELACGEMEYGTNDQDDLLPRNDQHHSVLGSARLVDEQLLVAFLPRCRVVNVLFFVI